uniref:CRM domain-containing protein n=2 Tax=Kalanchoe fedtschenkoi TaxID=63787 RepID=A0A7N1A4B3_KALFE
MAVRGRGAAGLKALSKPHAPLPKPLASNHSLSSSPFSPHLHPLLRRPSFCDVICKAFNHEPAVWVPCKSPTLQLQGRLWVHSCAHLNNTQKAAEQAPTSDKSSDAANVGDATGATKIKRKKLKGKRAVVRWLKFFRYKKKKEYERMTPEEKILYKLRKARKKEERMVESLKKLEPKETSETAHDPEILSPEEHFYFLKMGLKCKNYVPVGRRGIYQGVILNMHLHWKKHQTLQVIVKTFTPEEVKEIAVELARLTGGIVLDIHEENTIIMYRGKNYVQPPTEIMSPRVTLSRKKALDKSKYRDGLRAVRKYIPRLQQDLELLQAHAKNHAEIISEPVPELQIAEMNIANTADSDPGSRYSARLRELIGEGSGSSDDEANITDLDDELDSSALSDIFETESDSDAEAKEEKPLYLDAFERIPVNKDDGSGDFEAHLRQISLSARSKKSESGIGGGNTPDFDEVDQMVLRAASLLKKKRK